MNHEARDDSRVVRALYQTTSALSTAIEFRDPYTVEHQSGVATLARVIARLLKLPTEREHGLRIAATLHDVGKIAVPSDILNKPRRLNEQESALVQLHPTTGYKILMQVDFPWPVAEIVLQHHERIDGSGYPNNLVGEDILFEARIIAVADTIDAMLVDRAYRRALPVSRVVDELRNCGGVTLDPAVTDTAIELLTTNRDIFTRMATAVQRQPVVRAILESR